MWVRTQGKRALINVDNIKCDDEVNKRGKYPVWTFDSVMPSLGFGTANFTATLGEYLTKEQALKVLDEIEERINEGCPFVYQMPEDETEAKPTEFIFDDETADYVIRELRGCGFDIRHTSDTGLNIIIDKIIDDEKEEL